MPAMSRNGSAHLPARDGPYRVERLVARPWALVWDPDGFVEATILAYLIFAAWQDAAPSTVRSDARWLASAATWLGTRSRWAERSLDGWTVFLQAVALDRLCVGQRPFRAACHAAHALHRAYAYWHWADPETFPRQPFPATPAERQHWVALILGDLVPSE